MENRETGRKKRDEWFYRTVKAATRLVYPKTEVRGVEMLPDEPVIAVGNHSQVHGPIVGELYYPRDRYIWCASQMMELKEVPGYAYQDFWSRKPKLTRPFFKLLSYLIAPLSVCIFNNADTIPVYRDRRSIHMFRETMKRLDEGADIIIFPEHDEPYNEILCDFEGGFVDVAKLYYKKTGKELSFVPMYLAPKLRLVVFGRPIRYQAAAPIKDERERIRHYVMEEITRIAGDLPEHTVILYRNVPKREYPKNRGAVRSERMKCSENREEKQ